MTMCCVNYDGVSSGMDKGFHTLHSVGSNAHTSCHAQAAFGVLASHGFVLSLGNVLVGDKSYKVAVLVHNGEFLDFIFLQNLCSREQVGLLCGGNEVFFGHYLVNALVELALKTQVTVCNDTHEVHFVVNDGNTANVIFAHQVECVLHCFVALDGHRVVNHTIFGTFYDSHLACLILDAHVFMNNTDTTLACNGNGHGRLCYSIHRSCNEGYLQVDVA